MLIFDTEVATRLLNVALLQVIYLLQFLRISSFRHSFAVASARLHEPYILSMISFLVIVVDVKVSMFNIYSLRVVVQGVPPIVASIYEGL